MITYEQVIEGLKIRPFSTNNPGNRRYVRNLNRLRQILRYAIGGLTGVIENELIAVPNHTIAGIAKKFNRSEETIGEYVSVICLETSVKYKIGDRIFHPPWDSLVLQSRTNMPGPESEYFRNPNGVNGTPFPYTLKINNNRPKRGAQ